MINLPSGVKASFMRLKKENSQYLEIKHIKGYFFVYKSTSKWDKQRKKPIKVPLYFGRIDNDGKFIPAKKRKPRSASQQPLQALEKPLANFDQRKLEPVLKEEGRYKHESTLLTALSMNGRISIAVLGRLIGLKETAVSSQVRKLERKYAIRYMAEIDTTKLGYIQFLITVKFIKNIPKADELKRILFKEPRIQLAFMTKGDYDLMLYVLAKDILEMGTIVIDLRQKIDYPAIWSVAPVFEDYGFIPLREEFIDLLKTELLVREHAVLKELVKNGKIDFTEIDKIYKFDRGRSQYSYYRLKERGIIKRITISMHRLPIKYVAVMFEDIVNASQFRINREMVLQDIIESTSTQINKYLLVDDTFNPKGVALYMPIFNDGELDLMIEKINAMNIGTINRVMIITSVLVGDFCFRSFDNAYSMQEDSLIKMYKSKPLQKIDYEETGRIKKERIKHRDIRGL